MIFATQGGGYCTWDEELKCYVWDSDIPDYLPGTHVGDPIPEEWGVRPILRKSVKLCWAVQGKLRSTPNGGWITLSEHRRIKDTQINKVNERALRFGLKADYRVVLVPKTTR